jgi:hypothetical protein
MALILPDIETLASDDVLFTTDQMTVRINVV